MGRPSHRCWALAALVSSGWLVARGAQAQADAPECASCESEEQHSGFYMRLSVGLGATALEGRVGTSAAFGGSSSFAFGYFILPNLALSLDLFGANAYNVALSSEWTYPAPAAEFDVRSLAAGISFTYYLPLDFYASAGAGVGWLMLSTALAEPQLSGAGFAFDALAGREFWIGGSWALGVGVQFIYVRGDGGIDAVDAAWSLGTLFTVTKN